MLIANIVELLKNLPPELSVFFLSMLPVTELRFSIPVALTVYKLSIFSTIFFSVWGAIMIVLVLLVFLEKIYLWISKTSKRGEKFFRWIFNKTERKFQGKYAKYGALALVLFVALPLPFTGFWSGAVAAFVFRIPFLKSFGLIAVGILVSSLIITLLTLTGVGLISIF